MWEEDCSRWDCPTQEVNEEYNTQKKEEKEEEEKKGTVKQNPLRVEGEKRYFPDASFLSERLIYVRRNLPCDQI